MSDETQRNIARFTRSVLFFDRHTTFRYAFRGAIDATRASHASTRIVYSDYSDELREPATT
jgi:hypothetical protein